MRKDQEIPSYFVYGLPPQLSDYGLIHLETVMARQQLHWGHVIPHRHESLAQIQYWAKGSGTFAIDTTVHSFTAPALIFLPSRVVHGFDVDQQADALCITIADEVITEISAFMGINLMEPMIVQGDNATADWAHIETLTTMIAQQYADAETRKPAEIKSLAALILLKAYNAFSFAEATVQDTGSHLALRLSALIEAHFRHDWSAERYATELASSAYQLSHAARKTFHISVKQLILERRLLEAKRQLFYTDKPVQTISFDVGFDDPSYFSRFFRRHTGFAPATWRRLQHTQKQDFPDPAFLLP